jgi:hypothetical protein
LVHDQDIHHRQQVGGKIPGWGRIQDDQRAALPTGPSSGQYRLERDLQLQEQQVGAVERGGGGEVAGGEGGVGAGGDHDRVVTVRGDADDRQPGWIPRSLGHESSGDAGRLQRR